MTNTHSKTHQWLPLDGVGRRERPKREITQRHELTLGVLKMFIILIMVLGS